MAACSFFAIDQRFAEVDRQFARVEGRFERLEQEMAETRRHMNALAESLQARFEVVMRETADATNARIDRLAAEVRSNHADLKDFIWRLFSDHEVRIRRLETHLGLDRPGP